MREDTMEEQPQQLNMNDWYTPSEAASRLTANSGKEIETSYVRTLARYGKVRYYKISDRFSLYWKADIDAYIVEDRGEKSARAQRQKAVRKKTTKPVA